MAELRMNLVEQVVQGVWENSTTPELWEMYFQPAAFHKAAEGNGLTDEESEEAYDVFAERVGRVR